MSTVLEHPATELAETNGHAFNVAVWDNLVDDPALAALNFRIETDRHGQMIMSPPPAPSHGSKQSRIARLLGNLISGEVISECPLSTREGVKVIDVAWCSAEVWERLGDGSCFREAPQICVEVVSPRNTKGELEEKKLLYFEEGAQEVWFCEKDGTMRFFRNPKDVGALRSSLLPEFPERIG